ncbi:MAG: hypothetical protein LLF80_07825 [Porphyromonadaceae bacterium]|nr:hypothetical protein [Porphyromonadaceae bacterium]
MAHNLFKVFAVAMLLPGAFIGCEQNDDLEGIDSKKVAVQFRADNGTTTRNAVQGETRLVFDEIVNVMNFKINVAEIEFDFDDDFDDDHTLVTTFGETYSSDDDVEMKGPFEVDLILNGELQTETLLSGLALPNVAFEEIEFEMKKSKIENSVLYNQTILIDGEINGVPFIFSSDKEFDFEIEFDKPFVPGEDLGVAVDFHINQLFTRSLSGIDFTTAVPDNDGVIRISYKEHNEQSPNYQLGKKIWERLDDMIDCDFDDDDD